MLYPHEQAALPHIQRTLDLIRQAIATTDQGERNKLLSKAVHEAIKAERLIDQTIILARVA